MSIQETEVAKESYDIIILDDNLASVVKLWNHQLTAICAYHQLAEGDDQYSKSHSLQVKNTLIFNTFILCQIFNEFNVEK
ncbi:hypothetical protein AAHE18_13G231100 [Arachis hypogaea]